MDVLRHDESQLKVSFHFLPSGIFLSWELGTWILHTLVTLFSFAYLNGLFSPSLSQLALYEDRNLTTQAPCRRNTLLVAEIAVSEAGPRQEKGQEFISISTSVSHIHGPTPPKLSQWICNRRRRHSLCLFCRPLGVGTWDWTSRRYTHYSSQPGGCLFLCGLKLLSDVTRCLLENVC